MAGAGGPRGGEPQREPGTRVALGTPGAVAPFSSAGWSGCAPRRAAGGTRGHRRPGQRWAPAAWRLKSLIRSAWLRAQGAPRTRICLTPRPASRRPGAGPWGPPEPRATALRTPLRPPGGWAEAPRWRCWAQATTSRLEREGGEPTWRRSLVCREQTKPRGWQELVSFDSLRVPEPACPQDVLRASTPPAFLPPRGRSAQPAQVADLSEPDQGGQSGTRIPLSFGIANLAFKFRKKKGPTIWTKRCL